MLQFTTTIIYLVKIYKWSGFDDDKVYANLILPYCDREIFFQKIHDLINTYQNNKFNIVIKKSQLFFYFWIRINKKKNMIYYTEIDLLLYILKK